mmetsp:Transcript_9016/g.11351  ORF Transcript_9016/g.11351 Transcript_9016/m.11351 type:complete len:453 (+) Transcript_9016:1-1359(+)
MQEKMDKIARAKELDAVATAEIEEKVQKKMLVAEENKENMRREYSNKMQEKMDKIARAKELDAAATAEIGKKMEEKLACASARKSKIVAENVQKVTTSLKKKRKRVETARSLSEVRVQDFALLNETKLMTAVERKRELISILADHVCSSTKKRLDRAKHYKLAQDADVSSLKKNLYDKMFSVSQRKEELIATKSLKAAEENQVIAQRTKDILRQREIKENEIRCKHENKLESAIKRKKRHLEKEVEKNACMSAKREKVLESKLHHNDDISSLKLNLEEKMNLVSQRKESLIAAKASKAAADNKIISERTKDVLKERELKENQIRSKHENKLESATKRKLSYMEKEFVGIMSARRVKVLMTEEIKNTVMLEKAKLNLTAKLEEAAERREVVLMQKAEQADLTGHRSRCTENESVGPAPQVIGAVATSFQNLVDMLKLALSSALGIVTKLFGNK